MICLIQHNMKTLIICIGAVWLVLPATIALNYHLSLFATWHTSHLMEAYYIHMHVLYMTCARIILNLPKQREILLLIILSIVFSRSHDL